MSKHSSLESSLLRSSPEPNTNYSSLQDGLEDCEVGDLDFSQKSGLQFPSTSDDCLVYASILIDDATRGRSAALKLKSRKAMYAYKEYRSNAFRKTIFVTCWVLLVLTFFEGVSYKTLESTEPLLSLSVTSPIESICILIFAYNCYLEYVYLGGNFKAWRSEITTVYSTIAVFLMVLDICVCLSPTPFPRFSKPLRPLFMLTRMRHVRESVVSIINSTPAIIILLTLMIFFVLFGALLGWLIFDPSLSPWNKIPSNHTNPSGLCSDFSPTCNSYFARTGDAVYQSMILLTGANFPNIMLPYFHEAAWSAGFFVAHVTFGFYFLNRLLVAAAFTSYKKDTRKRINQTMRFRNRSLRRAFSVLSMVDDDYAFDKSKTGKNAIFPGENVNVDNDSTQKHIAKRSGDSVTLGQWIKLRMFTNYSRHYFLQHALRMTLKGRTDKEQAGNATQPTFTVESKAEILFNCVDDDNCGKIDQHQFIELCNYLGFKINARANIRINATNSWRSQAKLLIRNKYFQYFFDAVVVMSVARMILLRSDGIFDKNRYSNDVDIISYTLAFFFGVEIICKVYAMGFDEYWKDIFNRIDFCVVWPTITGTVFLEIIDKRLEELSKHTAADGHQERGTLFSFLFVFRMLRIFRVFRVVRLLRFSKLVWRVLTSFAKTLPILKRFLVIMMCVMYAFAVIGMEYFCDCLDVRIPAVAKSSYAYQNLQSLSFRSFGDSITVTFVMLMNRKFPAIMEGTIAGCNSYAPLIYYFSYYIIAVQILTSVFVAFVIEAYSNIKSKEDHDSESMDLAIMRDTIKDSIMVTLSAENNGINLSVIEDKFSIEHELSYVDLLKSTTKGASFARKRRLSSSPRKQGIGANGATLETNPTIELLREYNRELCNLLIHEYGCDPQTHPLLKKYRGIELQNRIS